MILARRIVVRRRSAFQAQVASFQELLEVGLILGAGGSTIGDLAASGRIAQSAAGDSQTYRHAFYQGMVGRSKDCGQFGRKTGIEVVKNFDGMVGKVQGMFVDDFLPRLN